MVVSGNVLKNEREFFLYQLTFLWKVYYTPWQLQMLFINAFVIYGEFTSFIGYAWLLLLATFHQEWPFLVRPTERLTNQKKRK